MRFNPEAYIVIIFSSLFKKKNVYKIRFSVAESI
jgi:hypothetical protein